MCWLLWCYTSYLADTAMVDFIDVVDTFIFIEFGSLSLSRTLSVFGSDIIYKRMGTMRLSVLTVI